MDATAKMARTVTPLNDTKIKKAKSDGKTIRLSDGGGLYLLVDSNGRKLWRFDYYRPYSKKRNTISFGSYPEVSLADARLRRDGARSNLAQNIDPQEERERSIALKSSSLENTFQAVAEEWTTKQNFAESTIKKARSLLDVIYKNIGSMPIDKITPVDVLNVCRIYERQGKLETAKKIKVRCGQVFRYGVATGRCERDVTQDLRGAIKTPVVQHMAAITDPNEFAKLLDAIDHYDGMFTTKIAFKMAPLVFVRPGELRHAKWADIDLDNAVWSYTPQKTKVKTGVELIVPLSTQVLALLREIHPVTSNQSEYVFPAITDNKRPMSDNTINLAFRRLGYGREEVSGHGFRASARTMLEEELEFPVEIIEMQLGHRVRDMHGRAYNRTKHLEKRKAMMQTWSDYCDEIKANVVQKK